MIYVYVIMMQSHVRMHMRWSLSTNLWRHQYNLGQVPKGHYEVGLLRRDGHYLAYLLTL